MLATGLEDDEVKPGTHVMFDCQGTLDLYCWDGGKTWVVEGKPEGGANTFAHATAQVADALLDAMRPGARISELQARARDVYRKAGVPDPAPAKPHANWCKRLGGMPDLPRDVLSLRGRTSRRNGQPRSSGPWLLPVRRPHIRRGCSEMPAELAVERRKVAKTRTVSDGADSQISTPRVCGAAVMFVTLTVGRALTFGPAYSNCA